MLDIVLSDYNKYIKCAASNVIKNITKVNKMNTRQNMFKQ